jgi:hypothetical protein
MKKIALGVLVLLLLFLAGINVRLRSQTNLLEERLAAAERKSLRTPPRDLPVELESPAAPANRPVVPEPAGKATVPPPSEAPAEVKKVPAKPLQLGNGATWILQGNGAQVLRVDGEIPGLTDAQRKAIEELRKNREAQAQPYRDAIAKIDDQTRQSIRQILTPEQLATYDAQNGVTANVTVTAQADEPPPNGRKPGFLGISGGDAPGGGAQVTQVIPNSVASRLGLQKDDVILEFNGEAIPTLAALASKIRDIGEGSAASLRIRRNGTEFYQGVQLGGLSK